ncbi:hypothetical protein PYW07_008505 [Mythimna separata]|uniref:C2H2-type domain-containing protein n=1 Tax=Mythimna separata TaxID=271217 RepID=A0AAD7YD70_MYTSE|nr:hypothetical protein PYW07_008505 [Mythimna separata]
MEEVETKLCENCKREIPTVNFTIHSVHCARNIRVCPVCKEPVLYAELKEHHEKLHKLRNKREIPTVNFTIHSVHCARNIRVCPVCKEPVLYAELKEHHEKLHKLRNKREIPTVNFTIHSVHCARNIRVCPVCKEPVLYAELKEHHEKLHKLRNKREIPTVNFTIHSVHCARNIRVCPVCKEPVLYAELKEHHEKLHKLQPCKKCGESVCGTDLEDHIRDSCGHTIRSCRYCELELPRRDLPAHENYCGVRTEQCPECREWVMIKYRQLHLDSNHGFIRLDDGKHSHTPAAS